MLHTAAAESGNSKKRPRSGTHEGSQEHSQPCNAASLQPDSISKPQEPQIRTSSCSRLSKQISPRPIVSHAHHNEHDADATDNPGTEGADLDSISASVGVPMGSTSIAIAEVAESNPLHTFLARVIPGVLP